MAENPDGAMDLMIRSKDAQKTPVELELSFAMSALVGEFRSIATAVREGQQQTLELHKELMASRQEQQQTNIRSEAMYSSLQKQIDELRLLQA
eukprot:2596927-Alexandrium_andersonii.AAC.1